jgi:hypothetical protein
MTNICSSLNIEQLTSEYLSARRLQCREFLDKDYAAALLLCLEQEVDWSVVLMEGKRIKELRSDRRQPGDDTFDLADKAYQTATQGFSYLFEANRRTSPAAGGDGHARAPLPATLRSLDAYLNSSPGLEFFRRVTSVPDLARAQIMATRYRPGDFLLFHDDDAGATRKAAFVINLTAGWQPGWGGLLQFLSTDGRVVDTFVPQFNVLHLFEVPQLHSVSFVAPFAQRTRHAISGWLYTD